MDAREKKKKEKIRSWTDQRGENHIFDLMNESCILSCPAE